MRYILTGVETNNKGAELMLYAILQQIELFDPKAVVYIEKFQVPQGKDYIKSKLDIRLTAHPLEEIKRLFKIGSILYKLHLPPIRFVPNIDRIDYLLDGSGLHFADKMATSETMIFWRKMFKAVKAANAKVIFLPQAFGPFNDNITQKSAKLLSNNADLIFARENISYKYLESLRFFNMNKVLVSTDFTSQVNGYRPDSLKKLDGGVCVIPNMQMATKGIMSYDGYLSYLSTIIKRILRTNYRVYILNHQGGEDERILIDLEKVFGNQIDFITGLNAIETKGLISTSYLVITSRFHGLASALNSCVPSLATSWSHKYKCLYDDYQQEDSILTMNDIEKDCSMIDKYLQENINSEIRRSLAQQSQRIQEETRDMWNIVWSLKK